MSIYIYLYTQIHLYFYLTALLKDNNNREPRSESSNSLTKFDIVASRS